MLCMDKQSTFYRKYAFGADGDKLAEQIDWLRAQQDRLPLCEILRTAREDGCCWYDMTYNPQAVGMFRYLHSNPVEEEPAHPAGGAADAGGAAVPPDRPRGGSCSDRKVH